MEEIKSRAKRTKKVDVSLELLSKLSQKLDSLEEQVKERDEKLKELEAKASVEPVKKAKKGFNKFGHSEWEIWEDGNDKGYERSTYVDVKSLMRQQYHGE